MWALLTYLLPRQHTSLTRSIGITLVAALFCGISVALADALPGWLIELGWQRARENDVLAWSLQAFRTIAALAYLMCMFSGGIAFSERAGILNVPELEFQLALLREYLKDFLGFDRDSHSK